MKSSDNLLLAFESGQIESVNFGHEQHVRVAWALARKYDRDEAFRRLVRGIRGIAARAGRPSAYHETITRAWFELVSSAEDLEEHGELFDKSLLGRFYTASRLAEGRERWLEPDLHPLGLPPPERQADKSEFKDVLRRVPTAVAVLTAHADGSVHAATVSSVSSVSLDPPLVSVCVANGSRTLALVQDAQAFALSILASDQDDLPAHFADPHRRTGNGQFAEIAHHLSPFGPVLDNASAWIGCRIYALHGCGDHHIVVGQVELAEATARRPLVRHDGAYH